MPRCCGHSSVNFPRGQRDCGFSEAQGGSQERLGTFGLSFQAGLPKVWKLQHRYFTLPNLSSSSPAKPGPGTQKEVSLETLGISFTIHPAVPSIPTPHPSLTRYPVSSLSFMGGFCYLAGEGMATNPVTSACPAAHICHALASVPGNPSESYLPQMRPCRILCIFTTLASQLPLLTFVSPRYRIGLSPHTFLHLFCLKQLS